MPARQPQDAQPTALRPIKLPHDIDRRLSEFSPRQSDDDVKRDLELIHDPCGAHVCDVEPDDLMDVLARVCLEHVCGQED